MKKYSIITNLSLCALLACTPVAFAMDDATEKTRAEDVREGDQTDAQLVEAFANLNAKREGNADQEDDGAVLVGTAKAVVAEVTKEGDAAAELEKKESPVASPKLGSPANPAAQAGRDRSFSKAVESSDEVEGDDKN